MTKLAPIGVEALKRKLDSGQAVLIDIREADEQARERIPAATSAPLSRLPAQTLPAAPIAVFHCKSGMRTQANAEALVGCGFTEAYFLEGGIEAWKSAGLPVIADKRAPLEIMRQVQIAAGALVLLGVGLGFFAHPGFFGLAAFVGAGLTFAGLSGWCGMALLLRAAPWNQPKAAA